MAARDFYTQDYFAAQLMKLNPMDVVMIRQAVERGLALPDEIELAGEQIPEGLTPFEKPDTHKLDFSTSVLFYLLSLLYGQGSSRRICRIRRIYPD